MPGRSTDGLRRVIEFDLLREYPVEVEAFDPALARMRLGERRAFFDPDPDDTEQLVGEWFGALRRRVPYPQWYEQLHGLVDHWEAEGCRLPNDYVRKLERWIRECQEIAAQRALLTVDRPAEAAHPSDTTRGILLHVPSAPVIQREHAIGESVAAEPVVNVSSAAVAESQQPSWWQRTKTELYWLGQMLIGRREGPDGKPQRYPWSPFREWARDAKRIPLNPVPVDAIADAAEGDLRPAAKEAALHALSGGLSKYRQGPKTVLRFADQPVKFTGRMLSQSETVAKGRRIRKVATLVKLFGGTVNGWIKKKGWDESGKEWHWYEHRGIGRVGVKPAGSRDPF